MSDRQKRLARIAVALCQKLTLALPVNQEKLFKPGNELDASNLPFPQSALDALSAPIAELQECGFLEHLGNNEENEPIFRFTEQVNVNVVADSADIPERALSILLSPPLYDRHFLHARVSPEATSSPVGAPKGKKKAKADAGFAPIDPTSGEGDRVLVLADILRHRGALSSIACLQSADSFADQSAQQHGRIVAFGADLTLDNLSLVATLAAPACGLSGLGVKLPKIVPEIRFLDVSQNNLALLEAVSSAALFPNLRALDLSRNSLRSTVLETLMQQLDAPLEYLNVSDNPFELFHLRVNEWPVLHRHTLTELWWLRCGKLKIPLIDVGEGSCRFACPWNCLSDTLKLNFEGTLVLSYAMPAELGMTSTLVIVPECLKVSDNSVTASCLRDYVIGAETGVGYNSLLRLLVVGYGGVGKTTLVEALLENRSWRDTVVRYVRGVFSSRQITFGVDIEHDWRPRLTKAEARKAGNSPANNEQKTVGNYDSSANALARHSNNPSVSEEEVVLGVPPGEERVQVWDFAGQPEFYPMHLLFLDADALYLLCFSVSEAVRSPESLRHCIEYLEEWADLIGSRAGNARVLLVGTQLNNLDVAGTELVPLRRALDAFVARCNRRPPSTSPRMSIPYFTNSLGKIRGVDELRISCAEAAADLLAVRPPVPAGYLKLRARFETLASTSPVITVCKLGTVLVDDEFGLKSVFSDARMSLRILHSWGWICYFDAVPDLDDFVFLSPQWLSKMLASVAVSLRPPEERPHLVFRSELARVWRGQVEISDFTVDALIHAMIAFHLLYRVFCGSSSVLDHDLIDEVSALNGLEDSSQEDEIFLFPGLLQASEPPGVLRLHAELMIKQDMELKKRGKVMRLFGASDDTNTSLETDSDSRSHTASTDSDSYGLASFKPVTKSTVRRYDFSILVPGFVSNLIVRCFKTMDMMVLGAWRSGVALKTRFGFAIIARVANSLRALRVLSSDAKTANLIEAEIISVRDSLCPRVAIFRAGILLSGAIEDALSNPTDLVPTIDSADIEIDPKKCELLGRGSYGAVYAVVAKQTARILEPGRLYAVKVGHGTTEATAVASRLHQEFAVMERFHNHLHLVPAVARMVDADGHGLTTMLISPLFDMSLERLIRDYRDIVRSGAKLTATTPAERARLAAGESPVKYESIDGLSLLSPDMHNKWFSARMVREWTRQIAAGLAHLHMHQIAHLDVKLDNVLVRSVAMGHLHLALCDFGVAHQGASGSEDVTKIAGTRGYLAPEAKAAIKDFAGDAYCPMRADMYSFGVLIGVLLTGLFPSDQNSSGSNGSKGSSHGTVKSSNDSSERELPRVLRMLLPDATLHHQEAVIFSDEWRRVRVIYAQALQPSPLLRPTAAGALRALEFCDDAPDLNHAAQQFVVDASKAIENRSLLSAATGSKNEEAGEPSKNTNSPPGSDAFRCLRDQRVVHWMRSHCLADLIELPVVQREDGETLARMSVDEWADCLSGDYSAAAVVATAWKRSGPYRYRVL